MLGKNVGLDTLNTLLADMQPAQKPLDLVRPPEADSPSATLTWDKATPNSSPTCATTTARSMPGSTRSFYGFTPNSTTQLNKHHTTKTNEKISSRPYGA